MTVSSLISDWAQFYFGFHFVCFLNSAPTWRRKPQEALSCGVLAIRAGSPLSRSEADGQAGVRLHCHAGRHRGEGRSHTCRASLAAKGTGTGAAWSCWVSPPWAPLGVITAPATCGDLPGVSPLGRGGARTEAPACWIFPKASPPPKRAVPWPEKPDSRSRWPRALPPPQCPQQPPRQEPLRVTLLPSVYETVLSFLI